MVKYTNASMTTLYDSRDEVINANIRSVFMNTNEIDSESERKVIIEACKAVIDACNGKGVFEVHIKDDSTLDHEVVKSNVISETDTVDLNVVPTTDIMVGQEVDVEVKPTFNVGDRVKILSVYCTNLSENKIGTYGIVTKISGFIHVDCGSKVQAFREKQLELAKIKVGDKVKILDVRYACLPLRCVGMEGIITELKNNRLMKVQPSDVNYAPRWFEPNDIELIN